MHPFSTLGMFLRETGDHLGRSLESRYGLNDSLP